MKTNIILEDISDGQRYDIHDMVKADTGGCNSCSACCHNVGDLVTLNPFDVYNITSHLGVTFDALLDDKIELRLNGKLTLPHLKMQGDLGRCSFLDQADRCAIHAQRPNICRLFPLGRVYEDDDFKYFLQKDACVKPHLSKVKIKHWIDIDHYEANKAFILSWYKLIKALNFRTKFIHDDESLKELNTYLLDTFYRTSLKTDVSFYAAFNERLPEAKNHLGIL
ncbi:YkgJ family cysteine cluster protein [Fusibacter ferrireducens]|uniref:YkgJ family cysteine cluster protein n=1 Tax=Fusibacter ferrireducens TaxID=2785058 RepID=A0ABR9ZUS7_9FIRM|nr:YkgJ family cysteine cluster protein [Fusibacter ferrireducens]MBF4694224.1 YkgJ family cysteine cluster protein [Fusibacter ferrireducens]